MIARGILGSGWTRTVFFWPFPNSSGWGWLISSVFLIRISCHKTAHANGYYGAWPGWMVSISMLPLTHLCFSSPTPDCEPLPYKPLDSSWDGVGHHSWGTSLLCSPLCQLRIKASFLFPPNSVLASMRRRPRFWPTTIPLTWLSKIT